jgi:hypothetical protein
MTLLACTKVARPRIAADSEIDSLISYRLRDVKENGKKEGRPKVNVVHGIELHVTRHPATFHSSRLIMHASPLTQAKVGYSMVPASVSTLVSCRMHLVARVCPIGLSPQRLALKSFEPRCLQPGSLNDFSASMGSLADRWEISRIVIDDGENT